MPCEVQALGVLMSQGGHAFIPAAPLCVLQILALKPHLPGSWRVRSILPRAHQHQLFSWQAQPWPVVTCPLETPFLAALLWLACMAQQKWHVPARLRAEMKIHIYLGHRLDLQDGFLLKREEIRNQASLTKYNRQISFLNILSDLNCSSQERNKKYLFCNQPYYSSFRLFI